LVKLDIT